MKKLHVIILLALAVIPVTSFSQHKVKFGHVNYGELMKIMPGIDSAQATIAAFQKELQTVGEGMTTEFQTKQAEYQKLSATATSPTVIKLKEEELTSMYKRIQEYSQTMESELQAKQLELLKPFQEKLLAAIKEIAKAENFTYVFDTSTLTYYQQGEDISDKVKVKLVIK
ncbi:MAG: OmpH family outer membrane protein [Bacteroidales bacterium]